VALSIKQQVDPSYLLRPSQWQPQGWSVLRQGVTRQLGVYTDGSLVTPVQVDAFEWVDVNGFGVGNADDGLSRLRSEIQRRGSDLYAYALLRREVFNVNVLGFQVGRAWSYRLVVVHSIVQLVEFAVVILAIAFAAIIFIQYLTTGRSPAVDDMRAFWGGLITDAGNAAGQVGAGISEPFVWLTIAGGVTALAFALAGKSAGVKTRAPSQPRGQIGVRAGPVSGRVGN
jgi:hypothetical protein